MSRKFRGHLDVLLDSKFGHFGTKYLLHTTTLMLNARLHDVHKHGRLSVLRAFYCKLLYMTVLR